MWHLTIGSGSHFARWIRESRCRTFARLGGEKRPGTSSPNDSEFPNKTGSQWPKIMTAHLNTSYLWPQIQTSDSSSSSCAIFKSAITLASCRFSKNCSRWGSHAFHSYRTSDRLHNTFWSLRILGPCGFIQRDIGHKFPRLREAPELAPWPLQWLLTALAFAAASVYGAWPLPSLHCCDDMCAFSCL